jgi:hypothetical protein
MHTGMRTPHPSHIPPSLTRKYCTRYCATPLSASVKLSHDAHNSCRLSVVVRWRSRRLQQGGAGTAASGEAPYKSHSSSGHKLRTGTSSAQARGAGAGACAGGVAGDERGRLTS